MVMILLTFKMFNIAQANLEKKNHGILKQIKIVLKNLHRIM